MFAKRATCALTTEISVYTCVVSGVDRVSEKDEWEDDEEGKKKK